MSSLLALYLISQIQSWAGEVTPPGGRGGGAAHAYVVLLRERVPLVSHALPKPPQPLQAP